MRGVLKQGGPDTSGTTPAHGPVKVRVALAHACVQFCADKAGADVLHIKGQSVDLVIAGGERGTDADVLVRPEHLDRLLPVLEESGWRRLDRFATSSPFAHSQTYWHDMWGFADIHRHFPGIEVDPSEAFEVLWASAGDLSFAHVPVRVPDHPAQRLIQLMHAARCEDLDKRAADIESAWTRADPGERERVRSLADRLSAQVALSAAIGGLDEHAGHSTYDLWRVVSVGGTRSEEWRARVRAARTKREALGVILRMPLVNTDHLRVRLGHEPSRTEVLREFFDRPRVALRQRRERHR